MSKLQRVVVILVAFGIISILLTQIDSSFSSVVPHKPPERFPSQQQQITTNINLTVPNEDEQTVSNANPLPVLHADDTSNLKTTPVNLVTNIYQTASGSFYFEHPNAQVANMQQTTTRYQPSTLQSTDANITITGPIARTRLTQVFSNTSNVVKSGVYVFPLPPDAAVDHLSMQVGKRKIEGKIKRKEVAHRLYTKAKASGKNASLLSQLRPNMFTSQVANIPPHSQISVTIEYQQFIVQDKYNYSLRLPLSITQRYMPVGSTTNQLRQFDTNNEPTRPSANQEHSSPGDAYLPAQTSISIRLNTGLPVSNIISEHHPITVANPFSTEYRIKLDTHKPVNKDFVLNWELQPTTKVQASHFTYADEQYEYGLITILGPNVDKLKVKRNVVFILDVSGSMVGDSLTQAKQSIALAIDDLTPNDYFNLIAFSSHTNPLWQQSQLATNKTKQNALTFLYELEANGGTEIKPALDYAMNIPAITQTPLPYQNQIIFMTDGSVSNEEEVMQSIYQNIGEYRLFTVGIGSAPNGFFMTQAASAGKGTYTFIGDINTVKPKMMALISKLKKPALNNLQLNFKDNQDAFGFEIYPSILPDVYAGQPLVISYRREISNLGNPSTDNAYATPFNIQGTFLSNSANGDLQERKWQNSLPASQSQREQGIHKYWARLKIRDLSQRLIMQPSGHIPSNNNHQEMKKSIKEGITKVALQHNLVSKYTSLVAIDPREQRASPEHELAYDNLARNAGKTLARTATTSGLSFVFGVFCLLVAFVSRYFYLTYNK